MSPNGRRAWRKWMRRVEHDPNLRPQGKSISRLAREGKRHLGSIPPTPAKPFTARSLVGMTTGARKRKRWATVQSAGQYDAPGAARYIGGPYRIGERLRPCPGCMECDPSGFASICDGSGVLPARKS